MFRLLKKAFIRRDLILFFVGGVTAFFLDLAILNFQVFVLEFNPFVFGIISIANIISVTIALTFNFFFQKFFSFTAGKSKRMKSELWRFILVQIFTIIFFGGIVFGIFFNLGLGIFISKVITTLFQMISSFFLYKFFVFKKVENL